MTNFSNKILPECRSWKEAGQEGRDGENSGGGGGMDLKDWTVGPSSWNPNISSLLLAVKGQAIWLQELAKKGTEPGHKLNYQLQWGWCLSSDTFNSLAVWELRPSEALPASEVLQAFTLPRLPRHPAPSLLVTEDSATRRRLQAPETRSVSPAPPRDRLRFRRLLLSGVHTRPEENKFGCSWLQPGKTMWVKDNQPAKEACILSSPACREPNTWQIYLVRSFTCH